MNVTNDKILSLDGSKLTGTITIPIDTTLITTDKLITGTGSVSDPSITFKTDTNTGIYNDGAGQISFVSDGTDQLRLNTNNGNYMGDAGWDVDSEIRCVSFVEALGFKVLDPATIQNVDGTVTNPSYTFRSSGTMGIYKRAAETVSIASNSTEVARFNFSGNQMFVPLTLSTNQLTCGCY